MPRPRTNRGKDLGRSPIEWAKFLIVGVLALVAGLAYAARRLFIATAVGAAGGSFTLFLSGVLYARRLVELDKPGVLRGLRDPKVAHGRIAGEHHVLAPKDWRVSVAGAVVVLVIAIVYSAFQKLVFVLVGGGGSALFVFGSGVLYERRLVELGKQAKFRLLRPKGQLGDGGGRAHTAPR